MSRRRRRLAPHPGAHSDLESDQLSLDFDRDPSAVGGIEGDRLRWVVEGARDEFALDGRAHHHAREPQAPTVQKGG